MLGLCLYFTGFISDFQFLFPSIVHNIYLDCFGGEINVGINACKFPGTVSCTMWIHRILVMVLALIAEVDKRS